MTLDVKVVEESLAACLSQGRRHRRAAALVVDSARRMPGEIGEMGRRLRRRFPKASVPPTAPWRYMFPRRRRAGVSAIARPPVHDCRHSLRGLGDVRRYLDGIAELDPVEGSLIRAALNDVAHASG